MSLLHESEFKHLHLSPYENFRLDDNDAIYYFDPHLTLYVMHGRNDNYPYISSMDIDPILTGLVPITKLDREGCYVDEGNFRVHLQRQAKLYATLTSDKAITLWALIAIALIWKGFFAR